MDYFHVCDGSHRGYRRSVGRLARRVLGHLFGTVMNAPTVARDRAFDISLNADIQWLLYPRKQTLSVETVLAAL
jgi:hypothetical protein